MSAEEQNNTNDGQSRLTVGLGKKMCLICEHFEWFSVEMSCGSEETGCWLDGGANCDKHHYYEERPVEKRDLLALFLKAETCEDYMPNVKAKGPECSEGPT